MFSTPFYIISLRECSQILYKDVAKASKIKIYTTVENLFYRENIINC